VKIEIVVTTIQSGAVIEKVVAHGKMRERTNIKDFLTWYAARLFKGPFELQRDDNVFGWAAVDSRGNTLTIR